MRSLFRPLLLIVFVLVPCFAGLSTAVAADEEWSLDGQQYPPTPPENRIIRWCSADGAKERFASANIRLDGYEPCGQLRAHATCDAAGTKLFSNDPNVPYDHKDCAAGPRIMVISHNPPVQPAPMNEPEIGKASFQREFKQLQKKQEEDAKKELHTIVEAALSQLLGTVVSPNPRSSNRFSRRSAKGSSQVRSRRSSNGQVMEIEILFDPSVLFGQIP